MMNNTPNSKKIVIWYIQMEHAQLLATAYDSSYKWFGILDLDFVGSQDIFFELFYCMFSRQREPGGWLFPGLSSGDLYAVCLHQPRVAPGADSSWWRSWLAGATRTSSESKTRHLWHRCWFTWQHNTSNDTWMTLQAYIACLWLDHGYCIRID